MAASCRILWLIFNMVVTAVVPNNDPRDRQMMITITGIDFGYHDYDERGDVMYLHVGEPTQPAGKALRPPRGIRSNTTSTGLSWEWS